MTKNLTKKISDVSNENQTMKVKNEKLQKGMIITLTTSNLTIAKIMLNKFVFN